MGVRRSILRVEGVAGKIETREDKTTGVHESSEASENRVMTGSTAEASENHDRINSRGE